MKERLLNGWNARRILYVAIGGWIVVQSCLDANILMGIAGAYFFSMGLFALGCAGGACAVPGRKGIKN